MDILTSFFIKLLKNQWPNENTYRQKLFENVHVGLEFLYFVSGLKNNLKVNFELTVKFAAYSLFVNTFFIWLLIVFYWMSKRSKR